MAEQDMDTSDGELPTDSGEPQSSMNAKVDDGVEGEMDDVDTFIQENTGNSDYSSTRGADLKNKDPDKHHSSSSHRHHRHHHSSSHRERSHRTSSRGDINELPSEPDSHGSDGLWKESSENHNSSANKGDRSSSRKHEKNRGNHSHSSSSQRSKHKHIDFSENSKMVGSNNSITHSKDHAGATNRTMKENRGRHSVEMKKMSETGDTEDGEILEDGELDDGAEAEDKNENKTSRDTSEARTSKSSSRDKSRSRHEQKKSEHKEKRSDNDKKRKKSKSERSEKLETDNSPAPAWGSGYLGMKPKVPEFGGKDQFFTGGKGYQSPPGLYDSPSYSEDSNDESVSKSLMTGGYIDASVAANEKEGVFDQKTGLESFSRKKKKKKKYEKNGHKRGHNSEGMFEGPPKKKAHTDLSMYERPPCRFYMEGKCAKGNLCHFNHDVEKTKKMEICKYHLTVKGCLREKCQYMHKDYPCKYYHTGAKCFSGEKCKFSHDPLTEDTRRALEMRVAPEDIIDMEGPEYNYMSDNFKSDNYMSDNYMPDKPKDNQVKSGLLGSPPRFRPNGRKIPSLFDIEVHPPSNGSSQSTRPSGFYNEVSSSPSPGMELNNANAAINNPTIGIKSGTVPTNQGGQLGFPNQTNNGGPGLLQLPPGASMIRMNAPIDNMMMMGNQNIQQQQQILVRGPPVQFFGPGQVVNNNNQQQLQNRTNLPPVLNMLGAIIREAALQKGSIMQNNMVPNLGLGLNNNVRHNLGNMPEMNLMNTNQNNKIMDPNSSLPHNIAAPINTGGVGPPHNSLNMMGNAGLNISTQSMGPFGIMANRDHNIIQNTNVNNNSSIGSVGVLNSLSGSSTSILTNQQKVKLEVDADYSTKNMFDDIKEESQDLYELDKIRQQIQAQIDKEDEDDDNDNADGYNDTATNNTEGVREGEHNPEKSDSSYFNDEPEHLEVPSHLPKKQQELFKRIQQQQLLREKETERQEHVKAAQEDTIKAELDDWYSSDEDQPVDKPMPMAKFNKPNNESPPIVSSASSSTLGSITSNFSNLTSSQSCSSTFDIMQMISSIKNQSSTSAEVSSSSKLMSESAGSSLTSPKLGESPDSFQQKKLLLQPASIPFSKISDTTDVSKPNLYLPTLTVNPPVVHAVPVKPLVYAVIKISLNMPKPYSQLPDGVNAADPAIHDDPRVKWHLNYLEKLQIESQRKDRNDDERPQKSSDPRLNRKATDSQIVQFNESPTNGKVAAPQPLDPRLQRGQVSVDPRFARMPSGHLDPRLNRQNSQNIVSSLPNNMVAGSAVGMGGMISNQMTGSSFNLINNSRKGDVEPINYMGSQTNNMGGLGSNQMNIMIMENFGRQGQFMSASVNEVSQVGIGMNIVRSQGNQMELVPDLLNKNTRFQENVNINDRGNSDLINFQGGGANRGLLNEPIPFRSDSTSLDSNVSNPLDPRLRNQRAPGDPRLNRGTAPRDQQLNSTELLGINTATAKDSAFNMRAVENGEPKSLPNKIKVQNINNENPSYSQTGAMTTNTEQLNIQQTNDNWALNKNNRSENDKQLTSSLEQFSMQHSNTQNTTTSKFDYRNDPRFKRIKKVGQQFEMADNLSSADKTNHDLDPSCSSYSESTISSFQDSSYQNTSSPQLPNGLDDFDLPNSPTLAVVEEEPDVQVKDIFKTIDPTASPFC